MDFLRYIPTSDVPPEGCQAGSYGCVRPRCDVIWDLVYWGISYALFWPTVFYVSLVCFLDPPYIYVAAVVGSLPIVGCDWNQKGRKLLESLDELEALKRSYYTRIADENIRRRCFKAHISPKDAAMVIRWGPTGIRAFMYAFWRQILLWVDPRHHFLAFSMGWRHGRHYHKHAGFQQRYRDNLKVLTFLGFVFLFVPKATWLVNDLGGWNTVYLEGPWPRRAVTTKLDPKNPVMQFYERMVPPNAR